MSSDETLVGDETQAAPDFIDSTVKQLQERRDALTLEIATHTETKLKAMRAIKAARAERARIERLLRATQPRARR